MNRTLIIALLLLVCAATAAFSQGVFAGNKAIALMQPSGDVEFVLVSPEGKFVLVTPTNLDSALENKHQFLTAEDFGRMLSEAARDHEILMKEYDALSADYNLLAGRYNRLAAVQQSASVPTHNPETEKQLRREQALQTFLLLQSLNKPVQPYVVPPIVPNRPRVNCTSQRIGNITYTNCN
ncbi:MAG: hypothetical protein ACRD2Q_05075 [Terriglobales bacterium]